MEYLKTAACVETICCRQQTSRFQPLGGEGENKKHFDCENNHKQTNKKNEGEPSQTFTYEHFTEWAPSAPFHCISNQINYSLWKKRLYMYKRFFLHLLIKSPIFPMYIQAIELCYKSLSSLSHILQHLFIRLVPKKILYTEERKKKQNKKTRELHAKDAVPPSNKLPSYIIWTIKEDNDYLFKG